MIAAELTAVLGPPVLAAGWYLGPMVGRRLTERRLRARCAASGVLALTFDDGPSPEATPRLLELLRSRNAKATFFLLGSRAEAHPELVDAIVEDGHQIGSHSRDHLHAWHSGPLECTKDIAAGYDALAPWAPGTSVFRPPHGKMTLFTWAALRRRRAPLGWWTIDGDDRREILPDPGVARDRAERDGGGVVLLHDYHIDEERVQFMLKSTELLLDAAERHGWAIRTLGRLLDAGARRAA